MKRHIVHPRQQSMVEPEVPNPFVHRLELGTLDILKIAIMSVTIAPLRLLMVVLLLLLVWPLAAIGVACRSPEEADKPFTGWRCCLQPLIVFLCRGVFFMGGFSWITVRGVRVTSKEAPILVVAPHSTFFDALALVYMDLTSVVAKQDSKKTPCFGSIIQYTQPVLVSREDPDSRLNTIKEITRRCKSGGAWPQIFIFPEGTCSNRSCLISFKGGAFFPGVPVQPVCLRYNNKLDTITWTWDGPGAFQTLWLSLCQFHNNMEIEFLPVYTPSPEEIKNPKLFAYNVRQVMADCLGVPVTDHSYDDCRLMDKAQKLNMPMEAGLVEFQKLHQKLGISFEQMQELLDKFENIHPNNGGQITLEQFASYLQLPESPALQEVFHLYDRDGSGTIDFREYVIGLMLVSHPVNSEDNLQHAFKLFDSDNKGYLTPEELQKILRNAFSMEDEQAAGLFQDIDTDKDGRVTYDDFKAYAVEKPEYAKLFMTYHDMSTSTTSNGLPVAHSNGGDCKGSNGNVPKGSYTNNVDEPIEGTPLF
ncbi:hypothetical protein V1264_001176 [Littorina saxatilis]|uniref:EF-hand domain-containing protein n=1 Tax=Littorina saxatilis TaxID=31220 RepID=A0AAN9GPE3_9CAEN